MPATSGGRPGWPSSRPRRPARRCPECRAARVGLRIRQAAVGLEGVGDRLVVVRLAERAEEPQLVLHDRAAQLDVELFEVLDLVDAGDAHAPRGRR